MGIALTVEQNHPKLMLQFSNGLQYRLPLTKAQIPWDIRSLHAPDGMGHCGERSALPIIDDRRREDRLAFLGKSRVYARHEAWQRAKRRHDQPVVQTLLYLLPLLDL
jgi:hypothetical protein